VTVSLRLSCNTVHGYSSCAAVLHTDALTVEEARKIGDAHGWRHTSGRDYCPRCSGSKVRPRVIVAVPDAAPRTQDRPAERLQDAEDVVRAAIARASEAPWCARRTPPGLPEGVTGLEFVVGGRHGADSVARTGPAGNVLAAGDARYIALMDPEVGRAVLAVLTETRESVEQEGGIVEDSLSQAALDLADALLRDREGCLR